MNISVVIPTYKNKTQLLQNLRRNIRFLKGCEVIIVNDNPEEILKNDLRDFANLILIENNQNFGFAINANKGVKKAAKKYVMLINDDVLLLDDSFKKALDSFEKHTSLFAVSFAQKEKNNSLVGKNMIYWKRGLLFHSKAKDLESGYNAWADGGACIIDKSKFLELGGFDSIYNPFYWEDIDLSYRAWKQGYKIFFDPHILVQHHHGSTIGKYFPKKFIDEIAYRNQIIFIWKNITDLDLITKHLFYIPLLLFKSLIKGNWTLLQGFILGTLQLAKIIESRQKTVKLFIKTDREILSLFE